MVGDARLRLPATSRYQSLRLPEAMLMEPLKRVPVIRPPARPVNNNPLTRKDALRIARAITSNDNAKAMLECVCVDDPGRTQVADFLDDCQEILLNHLLRRLI
jgi:hypothetical protein